MFGRLNGAGRDTLDVSLDKLAQIVVLARAYDGQMPESDPDDSSGVGVASGPEGQSEDPAGRELRNAIESLSDDEQAVVVALSWIGRGEFGGEEFDTALTTAFERRQGPTADYLIGIPLLGDLIEQGAAACGVDLSDAEAPMVYRPNGAARH